MNLLKEILILVIGFVLLIKGADYFVEVLTPKNTKNPPGNVPRGTFPGENYRERFIFVRFM